MEDAGYLKSICQGAGGMVGALLGAAIYRETGALLLVGFVLGIIVVNYIWKEVEEEKKSGQREKNDGT